MSEEPTYEELMNILARSLAGRLGYGWITARVVTHPLADRPFIENLSVQLLLVSGDASKR